MHPRENLSSVRILSIIGVSGAGKTTVVNSLIKMRPEFERVISCTTRPHRDSDPLGEYAYLSDGEFDDYVRDESFLWINAYAGYRYGTLTRSVNDALKSKYPRIMTLTPEKARLLWSLYPSHVLTVHVSVPDEIIRERLLSRGDDAMQIEMRITVNRKWKREQLPMSLITLSNFGKPEETARDLIRLLAEHAIIT